MTPPAKKTASKPVPSLAELTSSEKEETPAVEETAQPIDTPIEPETETNPDPIVENEDPDLDSDASHFEQEENKEEPFLSPEVVSTVPNKTPAELSAETPDETAARYGVDTTITEEDAKNPRVQVYEDTPVTQVPSGTHLHPDIAKDLLNRGISQNTTDSAQVSRMVTNTYDFAPDAEYNDKFQAPSSNRDEDYEDVPPNAGSTL